MPSTKNSDSRWFLVGLLVMLLAVFGLLDHYKLLDDIGEWLLWLFE